MICCRYCLARWLNKLRNAKAKWQASVAIPPDPLDCRRPPILGPTLPYKMGSGGWPVQEPTREDVEHFCMLISTKVPIDYLGGEGFHPTDKTCFASVTNVLQWLRLANEAGLFARDPMLVNRRSE